MSGVLTALDAALGKSRFGLPSKHFLDSLLWYPKVGCTGTYNTTLNLPSWSWVSWIFTSGGVYYDISDAPWLQNYNVIQILVESWKHQDDSRPVGIGWDIASRAIANLVVSKEHPIAFLSHNASAWRMAASRISSKMPEDFNIVTVTLDLHTPYRGESRSEPIWHVLLGEEPPKPDIEKFTFHDRVLVLTAVVATFNIGENLGLPIFRHNDETGVFELRNREGEVVGQVTTSHQRARTRRRDEDLIAISWGLSLRNAKVHPRYVPIWESTPIANSVQAGLRTRRLEGVLPMIPDLAKYIPERMAPTLKDWMNNNASTNLATEIGSAQKGDTVPRFLWPVVNLLLVDWDGQVARRAGVGKVMMAAWHREKKSRRQIQLA